MATKVKTKRQKSITEIVTNKKVETQQDLVAELRKRGFDVTQATVSRDIAELRLQRVRSSNNISYYVLPERGQQSGGEERLKSALRDFGRGVLSSENLIVIKTSPGGAQPVALALDSAGWEEVLGTIAGDDTVLVVTANAKVRSVVIKRLNNLREA